MKHSFQGTQDVNQSFEQSLCASRNQPRGLTERGPCPSASPLLSCVSLETPWLLRPVVRIGQGTNQTEVRGKNIVMTTSRPLLHHAHHLPHLQRKLLLKSVYKHKICLLKNLKGQTSIVTAAAWLPALSHTQWKASSRARSTRKGRERWGVHFSHP